MAHHGAGHGAQGADDRALKITTWITGVYFAVELGIGIYTSSIAVISDAIHTFSAVGGVLLALIAARIATRPADERRTFGYGRAEVAGALLNGFFLLIMAGIVIFMGAMRLRDPIDLPTTPMLVAAAGGLVTEFIAIRLLYAGQKSNLNVRGAFWHVLQTFVGSLIIIASALVIRFTGFVEIDPILGMAFGVVLLYAPWGIIKESTVIMLETAPDDVDLDRIRRDLEAIPGVSDVHHIHAWAVSPDTSIFSTHMLVEDHERSQEVLEKGQKVLDETGDFYFATMQLETECVESAKADDIDITRGQEGPGDGQETHHAQEAHQ